MSMSVRMMNSSLSCVYASFHYCCILYAQFAKTFTLDYYFEEVQPLKLQVYDVDDVQHISDLRRHDFIGEVELTLADVVSAGQQLTRTLRQERECLMHHTTSPMHACVYTPPSWMVDLQLLPYMIHVYR